MTRKTASHPPAGNMRRMVHGAGTAAKKAARASGKAAVKTAKFAGATVLPAAPVASGLAKGQVKIADQARAHMTAIKAGEKGAHMGALKALGKVGMAASTFVLPALAAAAAISTARDVYRRTGRIDEAAGEGAYSGVDLILGGAMAEYSRSREAGESRAAAVTSGVLEGVNNRFLFSYGDEIVKTLKDPSKFSEVWPGAPAWLKNTVGRAVEENARTEGAARATAESWQSTNLTRGADPSTLAIVNHGEAENARAMATPRSAGGAAAGPMRAAAKLHMAPADKAKFNAANDKFKANAAGPKTSAAGAGSGDPKKKGWANPAVQRSAQQARGVQNVSDWAEDAIIKSA